MESQNDSQQDLLEPSLQWMRECMRVTRRKTAALVNNDLAALEVCLEEEARLVSQWSGVTVEELKARPSIRESLESLAAEIRSINRTNARLIENGQDLSRTLLDVIRPPVTYSPRNQGEAPVYAGASESIISVEC
jgi:hypothetical protein